MLIKQQNVRNLIRLWVEILGFILVVSLAHLSKPVQAQILGQPVSTPAAEVGAPVSFSALRGDRPFSYGWYPVNNWVGIWDGWNVHSRYVGAKFFWGFSYWPWFNYAPYYASFGAISYSPSTLHFASSWGQPSLEMAQKASQAICNDADCKPVVWVQGGCAAIAHAVKSAKGAELPSGQKGVYWGLDFDGDDAAADAMAGCRNHQRSFKVSGKCQYLAWTCTI